MSLNNRQVNPMVSFLNKKTIFALRKVRYEIYAMKNVNAMTRTKQQPLDNPFVFQGYEGPEYFCDREEETKNMISALNNGRNITLISPRKIGKNRVDKPRFLSN